MWIVWEMPRDDTPSPVGVGDVGGSVGSLTHVFTGDQLAPVSGASNILVGNTAPALFLLILREPQCALSLCHPQCCSRVI